MQHHRSGSECRPRPKSHGAAAVHRDIALCCSGYRRGEWLGRLNCSRRHRLRLQFQGLLCIPNHLPGAESYRALPGQCSGDRLLDAIAASRRIEAGVALHRGKIRRELIVLDRVRVPRPAATLATAAGSMTITGRSQASNRPRSEVLLRPDVWVPTRRARGRDDRHSGRTAGIRRGLHHVPIDAWVDRDDHTLGAFQLLAQRGVRGHGRWLVRRDFSRCLLLHLGRCRR